MRDPEAVRMAAFTAERPDDRDAFDAWIARERAAEDVTLLVVTDRGGFAGTAAAFTVDGDREVSVWIKRQSWGHGVRGGGAASADLARGGASALRPRRRAQCGRPRRPRAQRVHGGVPQCRLRPRPGPRGRGGRAHPRPRTRRVLSSAIPPDAALRRRTVRHGHRFRMPSGARRGRRRIGGRAGRRRRFITPRCGMSHVGRLPARREGTQGLDTAQPPGYRPRVRRRGRRRPGRRARARCAARSASSP